MKKSILLVDDDKVVRDILKGALEQQYIILEAANCSEALKKIMGNIDLAIIDYMLPDGDGISILRTIRKIMPQLPVVMMTSYSSESVVIRALQEGVTDYVKKPLSLDRLRIKVADILSGKKGEAPPKQVASREEFIMDGIADFIENNYSDNLTRACLAEKVCVNERKFSKTFNEKFGSNLKSYINRVRVTKAAALLKNNMELNITDIATTVGYNNIVHFERLFKKIYGVSPKEFRGGMAGPSRRRECN